MSAYSSSDLTIRLLAPALRLPAESSPPPRLDLPCLLMSQHEPSWDDVAEFVAEYIAGKYPRRETGDLLNDIARAYVQARDLPPSTVTTVMQMVDSVL